MVTSGSGVKGTQVAAQLRPIWKAVKEAYNPRSTRGEPSEQEREYNKIKCKVILSTTFIIQHYGLAGDRRFNGMQDIVTAYIVISVKHGWD